MKKNYNWKSVGILLVYVFCLLSCRKVKTDQNLPIPNTLKSANSSIRLIALTYPTRVNAILGSGFTFNLTPITTLLPGQTFLGFAYQTSTPTPVSIPSKFLDQNGQITLNINYGITFQSITLKDDPNNPTDYYIITDPLSLAGYKIVPVIRSLTGPSVPSNFKLRIINQSLPNDPYGLDGLLSLYSAYGKPVNTALSNLPYGATTDYIEFPYGAYDFKIFNGQMRQLPLGKYNTGLSIIDSGYAVSPKASNNRSFNFQPGGVYTIFINSNAFIAVSPTLLDPNGNQLLYPLSLNSYNIITELNPSSNNSFARIDMINAFYGGNLRLLVDGNLAFDTLGYLQHSKSYILSAGKHHFSLLKTDDGSSLVEEDLTLNPFDYISLWAYQNPTQNLSKPQLIVSPNDMTNPPVDVSQPISAQNYFLAVGQRIRFLNLTTDAPYITFTNRGNFFPNSDGTAPNYSDTNSVASASQNVPYGKVITHSPYILLNSNTYEIIPFQSFIGSSIVSPGNQLFMVPPIKPTDFIADPSIYSKGYFSGIPASGEPGVYTVALVGSVSPNAPPDKKAKLLIINHIQ